MEAETDYEYGDGGSAGIDKGYCDGAWNVFWYGFGKAFNNMLSAMGVFGIAHGAPESINNAWAFGEHKEGEYECENNYGEKAADARNGGGEHVAEISGEIVGEALDDLGNLILKIGNAESAANFVDKANITRGGIKERRQTIEK